MKSVAVQSVEQRCEIYLAISEQWARKKAKNVNNKKLPKPKSRRLFRHRFIFSEPLPRWVHACNSHEQANIGASGWRETFKVVFGRVFDILIIQTSECFAGSGVDECVVMIQKTDLRTSDSDFSGSNFTRWFDIGNFLRVQPEVRTSKSRQFRHIDAVVCSRSRLPTFYLAKLHQRVHQRLIEQTRFATRAASSV